MLIVNITVIKMIYYCTLFDYRKKLVSEISGIPLLQHIN